MTPRPAAGGPAARPATARDTIAVHSPTSDAALRRGLLAVLGTAEFMLVLDLSIVNVALPRIQAGLGFTPGALA